MTESIMEQEIGRNKIHPKKFALLVACASMSMVFAAQTSAYMVRQASGNWLEFPLPNIFFFNTLVIVLSSVTLHGSYLAFKRAKENLFKGLLLLSLFLGIAFVVLQLQGWADLQAMGVPLKLNPSGDFIYAISGIHLAHVLGGITALLITAIVAFMMPFKLTPARKLRFEMSMLYWHFVDGLWVYLIVFWTLQR
ncbi:MAG: cytochrome oxidase subunit III [Bacteroidetes bacterium]|nr:MAG: cytochrome oxidase subunit III [Bacteroidota bacterium]PTM13589.1 MAG: cytochrome oxidase subunit III [Bacteroidota bacterium]